MASPAVASPSTGPVCGSHSVTRPLEAYNPDLNSAERASFEPAHEMQQQSKVRSRQQRGLLGRAFGGPERSWPESENTLTPGTGDFHEQNQAHRGAWSRLFSGFSPNPFSSSAVRPENKKIERGYNKIKYEKLENFIEGMPRLAALQNSNESFSIYRKFGPYAARVLLYREIELNELVGRLHDLDEADFTNEATKYRLTSIFHHDKCDPAQRVLIQDIEDKLLRYYDLLLKYAEVNALGQPAPRNIRSVHDWMVDNRPLVEGDDDFILHVDDLVMTNKISEQGNQIREFIEEYAYRNQESSINSFLKTKKEKAKTDNDLINHFASSRLSILINTVTVFLAVGGLLIPVCLLFLVEMSRVVMVTIALGFVLLFSVTMSVVTGARVQDVLVGTAAYGAVVIMFLGSLNQGPGLN